MAEVTPGGAAEELSKSRKTSRVTSKGTVRIEADSTSAGTNGAATGAAWETSGWSLQLEFRS